MNEESYAVVYPNTSIQKRVEKQLDKVDPPELRNTIVQGMLDLANNPRPFKEQDTQRISVAVAQYTAEYRLRFGDYRVLYDVDDVEKKVWILALRKRGEHTYK